MTAMRRLLCFPVVLVACSGGGAKPAGGEAGVAAGDAAAGPDTAPEPVVPTYAGRIVVTPAALLFTRAGEQAALHAEAFDAQGKKMDAVFTWESSRPGELTVD